MSNSMFEAVFRVIENHTNEVLEESVSGSDDIWSILVPYGRGKRLKTMFVGEEGKFVTRNREEYRDNRGISRPYIYKVVRIS